MSILTRLLQSLAVAAAMLLAAQPAFANATVVLLNGDPAGVGLNDPTPAAPVGGNTGTTVGQQRLIALQRAADIWGDNLDSPVTIAMLVSFGTRTCTPTAAVLASAGAWDAFANFGSVGAFPGPVAPLVWHHSALADKRAGAELSPGEPDLIAIFNVNLGQPTCFAGPGWYYGLDANEPAGATDLVAVALHEFGHGLGFSGFANLTTGANLGGLPNVYELNLLDTTTFKNWNAMTNAERAASAINARKVVWDGPEVFAAAPSVLSLGVPLLRVTAPAGIAGNYEVGPASYGPQLSATAISAQIVQGLDAANAAGPSTTDGCTAFTNAAQVAGKIALVDRGTCTFVVKTANAQAAGAVALLVADNAVGTPPAPLGGAVTGITIPSVRITITDGNTIKSQLANGVSGALGLNMAQRAGADIAGRVFVNATNPVQPGSSISHWDPIAFPNQLMEPTSDPAITHSLVPPNDLTLAQMRDIGWFADADNDGFDDQPDECDASILSPTVVVAGTDTGIDNLMFTTGCTMNDYLAAAADDAKNHGQFVSAVAHLGNSWRNAGLITTEERKTLLNLAAPSSVGK